MKNKDLIFIFIMLLMIACRIWMNNTANEVSAVAGINLISLLIVVVSMTGHMRDRIREKIEQTRVPAQIMGREITKAYKYVGCLYCPVGIFALLYFMQGTCELANDIISILALFLSLTEEGIAAVAADFYMEKCLWKKS